MANRQDSHHIQIKNTRTGQQEGFMLTSGDKPFTVQGVDTIATRISEGEILYSDFTNSRVFAQSEWSGGISKYWIPERIYSIIYPTLKYADAYNADVTSQEGEFTIGASALVAEDFPNPTTKFSSMTNGEAAGVVYAGVKGILKIYRSIDHGLTWTVYLDLTGDARFTGCDEIKDLQYIKTKYGMPDLPVSDLGRFAQQLWFIAWNNGGNTGYCGRKDIDSSLLLVSNSQGIYNHSGSVVNPTWVANYGNGMNTITIDTTVDVTTISLTIQWNYDVTNSLARIASGAPVTWYAGSHMEIFEGAVWNSYEIQKSITGELLFFGYSGSKVNGAFNCRIKTGAAIALKATAGVYVSYTGTSALMISSGFGRFFNQGGRTYSINGVMGNAGIFSFCNQVSSQNNGFLNQKHITDVDVVYIYDKAGAVQNMINIGTITINLYDFVSVMKSNAGGMVANKFFFSQAAEWEGLYGMMTNAERVYDFGCQSYGTSNADKERENLYCLTGGLNSWDPEASIYNNDKSFVMPTGYMPTCGAGKPDGSGFIGTQLGTDESDVQAKLLSFTPSLTNASIPVVAELATIGEQSISCMVFDHDQLWIGTNLDGWIYTYVNTSSGVTPNYQILKIAKMPVITGVTNNYIDSIASYAGKIVASYQNGPGVYIMDPNTFNINASPVINADILCTLPGVTKSQTMRITKLLSTGVNLLIGTNNAEELYYYNRTSAATECNITSSIYGGYISNVEKLWLYAYMRVEPWTSDDGQKVRLQMTFDEGNTWYWLPTKKDTPMLVTPLDFTDYEHGYVAGQRNDQFLFFYPKNTLSNTIQYRAWLYKGATYKPICNHISCHFMINYKQELLFNYNLQLAPNLELLDGRTIDKRTTQDKVAFLKEIWQRQDMCEFTHVDGKKYTGVPFSDDRTPGQGLVVQAQNANGARFDKENLAYNILFTLKTVANYEDTL